MGTYARNPVEFVRGEGTRLWDADGNEYLDFLAGISVVQIGHCHPALVEAVTEQAARLMHVGNLYYTEPAIRLAARLSELSLGGKAFLCNSGAEAVECALKLARRHRAAGRLRGGGGRLPRPHDGRAVGHAAGGQAGAVRAAGARASRSCRRDDPAALAAAVGPDTAAVLLEPIQGEGGIHPLSRRDARRRARGLRRARRAADLRRDPVRHGPHRRHVGLGGAGRAPRRDDRGQGPGRRAADRRLPDHARAAPTRSSPATTAPPSPAARWWPPARTRCSTWSTADGFLDDVRGARASGWPPACATLGLDVRGRGLMLAFAADRRARARPAAAARAAPGGERHRPRHDPPAAAAHRERGGDRRGGGPDRRRARFRPMSRRPHHQSRGAYEAAPGDVGRVLLLYSGGLDTSVMLKWIQDEYEAEVVALCVNLGPARRGLRRGQGQGDRPGRARLRGDRRARGVRARLRAAGDQGQRPLRRRLPAVHRARPAADRQARGREGARARLRRRRPRLHRQGQRPGADRRHGAGARRPS